MYSLYYSSFFHFISIELLKNNKIDFYEPYYGDYEGVTEAMCRAVKTVAVNKALCSEDNTGMFGFELIEKMLPYVTTESQIFLLEILQSYKNYILRRIEELPYTVREIKKRVYAGC